MSPSPPTKPHTAIATRGPSLPLITITVPTLAPKSSEIQILVLYTTTTPLDLHRADSGFLIPVESYPFILGSGIAGIVTSVGPDVTKFNAGDKVFGYSFGEPSRMSHQELVTAPDHLFGLIPAGVRLEDAVTVPSNFVSAWHSLSMDLNIHLPWPLPPPEPKPRDDVVLVWGGASSVGMYALQLLQYARYNNVICTSSPRHWETLKSYGAKMCFDYNDQDVVSQIQEAARRLHGTDGEAPLIPLVLDCIGSLSHSVQPISRLATAGSIVAIMLPVITTSSSKEVDVKAEYSMDVSTGVSWAKGVEAKGVRTHFYQDNAFHKEKLQTEIMPELLRQGVIQPNKVRLVEGDTMLERAQRALDVLRRGVSGERVVWRVAETGM